MTPPACVKVELFESETIVERGRKKVSYLIRHNDDWVLASAHPNAESERLSAGPGTVWEHRIAVDLPVGTRVCRVESVPRPEPARDALDYLGDQRKSQPRLTRRRELLVNPRGELVDAQEKPGRPRRSR
ncbi:MAG: hypothetical protein HS104_24730 [Polyangiaceae bacterium]|nr:hypothetical protein [Polyangiaceae bacterium]MCE7889562.1 hypothetical protein [Sorangiineae bacterium PRO1]MCL4754518.1 hypothetical protein [Myxococcales bacterium]